MFPSISCAFALITHYFCWGKKGEKTIMGTGSGQVALAKSSTWHKRNKRNRHNSFCCCCRRRLAIALVRVECVRKTLDAWFNRGFFCFRRWFLLLWLQIKDGHVIARKSGRWLAFTIQIEQTIAPNAHYYILIVVGRRQFSILFEFELDFSCGFTLVKNSINKQFRAINLAKLSMKMRPDNKMHSRLLCAASISTQCTSICSKTVSQLASQCKM